MSSLREKYKEMEEQTTPMECIDEIIECVDALYSEDLGHGVKKLSEDLSPYAGYISIIYKQAKLLKKKLS